MYWLEKTVASFKCRRSKVKSINIITPYENSNNHWHYWSRWRIFSLITAYKGLQSFGAFRRTSSVQFWRIEELGIKDHPNLILIEYDLTDLGASISLVQRIQLNEIYNLAAQSFAGISFDQPNTTAQITDIGALNLFKAVRLINPKIRLYQGSTSEMFGKVQAVPQTEETPFYPRSPYGVAKLFTHWMTVNYRESYDIFSTSGILFNYETPLRGREFVTRKITDANSKFWLYRRSNSTGVTQPFAECLRTRL